MIRQSYDLDADAAYIYLRDGAVVARTAEIGEGTHVDLDESGAVVGIEVISLRRNWPLEEFLARFPVSESDAAELRAYFPGGAIGVTASGLLGAPADQ